MSNTAPLQPASGIDYHFWLKHELLSLNEICLLARGYKPTLINEMRYKFQLAFKGCQLHSILFSASKAKEIKSYADGNASPLECFLYLEEKDQQLPVPLSHVLENDLEQIHNNLNKKIKGKRSKESYLPKEVRGDGPVLVAVLKTLLDLFPNLPKDELIHLKPVQRYANGHKHSDQALKKMISEIEDKKRKSGNVNKSKTDETRRTIPKSWKDC